MASEYRHRTAVTRLCVHENARERLERTISDWKRGCQIAADLAWNECHKKSEVQSLAYDVVREETALGSQHAVLATHQAAEAISSCVSRRANGDRASKPTFTKPTVRYDSRSMTLFDDGSVSLSTTGSRVRCELVLSDDSDGYQQQFIDDDAWELTESTLTIQNGTFYIHLGFRQPSSESQPLAEDGTVLGVDFGIENLAVTSTGQFFPGRELAHRRRQAEALWTALRRTGTRSARRTLRRTARRHRRLCRDVLHRVADGIVREALAYDCSVVAVENLSGIQSRLPGNSTFQSWAFEQLLTFVRYKCEGAEVRVVCIDPENTSRTCSRTDCHYVAEENRPTQSRFRCEQCGYQVHADYNAAKNIGLQYVRRGHTSSRRTGVGQCALKSGTVTPNGFIPYPDGFEVEFPDKSPGRDS